ncbi:hypothetical protein D9M71_112390 [compost metagenome]
MLFRFTRVIGNSHRWQASSRDRVRVESEVTSKPVKEPKSYRSRSFTQTCSWVSIRMVATVAPAALVTTHCPAYGVWVFVLSTAGLVNPALAFSALLLWVSQPCNSLTCAQPDCSSCLRPAEECLKGGASITTDAYRIGIAARLSLLPCHGVELGDRQSDHQVAYIS